LVNLQALLGRLSKICLNRNRINKQSTEVLWRVDDEPVLVLIGELTGGNKNLLCSITLPFERPAFCRAPLWPADSLVTQRSAL
jgi:hypothetical protein